MTPSVRERFAAASREERPDLAELCLLVGAQADPALDGPALDLAQVELDRLAGLLPYGLRSPAQWAAGLHRVLGAGHGFHGTAADYDKLESSLLQEVLRRRRGLPILLSVVWMEVARRAGGHVYGVGLPGHFVVGFGDPDDEHVLVDPFRGGMPLSKDDTERMVAEATGGGPATAMLGPADPLDMVQRVLNNVRAWAVPRPEHRAVQLWALDLALAMPRHPARLRHERARLLVAMGDFLGGAKELEEYAEVIGAFDPESARLIRAEARGARAMLNGFSARPCVTSATPATPRWLASPGGPGCPLAAIAECAAVVAGRVGGTSRAKPGGPRAPAGRPSRLRR